MSQVATGQPTPASQSPLLTALCAGRIASKRRYRNRQGQTVYLTVLKLAAVDEFTSPETIEVRSGQPLGEVGDTWRGKVRLGGYARSYNTDDPQTGEKITVQTADNNLTVVE